jgi:hypothetical protein
MRACHSISTAPLQSVTKIGSDNVTKITPSAMKRRKKEKDVA